MERSGPADEHDIERFREFLGLVARMQLDERHQAKLSASDVVQQTLLEAHERRAQFRGSTDEELAAWLRQILKNNLLDAFRALGRAKRDVAKERSLETLLDDSYSRIEAWFEAVQSTPSQHAAKEEQLVELAKALADLPEGQRESIVLHHLRGWSLAEVAVQLGRSESAVAGLLHRGLKKLREILAGGR